MEELLNRTGAPPVQVRSASFTVISAANGPPTAFWHIRQWHTDAFDNAVTEYRTAPH
jgi:hypothetical protein